MKKTIILGFGLTLATALANAAAITLTAGGAAITPGLVVPAGMVVGTTSGSLVANDISASYTETVYKDTTNIFGSGDVTLVLALSNIKNTGGVIESASLGSFSGYMVAAGYEAGSTNTTAGADLSITGSTVHFLFSPPPYGTGLNGGTETLVVDTNASSFNFNGGLSIQNTFTANAPGYQPAAPEPMSMSLLGGGLAILGALRFRRRKL